MRNYKELFRMTLMMLLEVALLEYQMQQTMLKTYAISLKGGRNKMQTMTI